MTTTPTMKNLKKLPYGGASYVNDPAMFRYVNDLLAQGDATEYLQDLNIHQKFVENYRAWINISRHNKFKNLNQFPIGAISLGTSESFDKFYLKNSTRRFRCFKGEYMYHAASWRNYFPGWCYLEEDDIQANDALVISMPFSDTGDIHPDMEGVLSICDRLGVPVLIDCAFFGICRDIEFDFDRPCITDIVFSLSKTFPVSHVRIGMRLTRTDDDDSLLVHHKTNYVNRLGAWLGIKLMDQYGPDWNTNKWRPAQELFCQHLSVTPSKTVIFGLGKSHWSQYNRGTSTNRLCFANYLSNGLLPNDRH
jgi:hypothetical protein